jgi:hypothetical protein
VISADHAFIAMRIHRRSASAISVPTESRPETRVHNISVSYNIWLVNLLDVLTGRQRDAKLPSPDPGPDSPTAALTGAFKAYMVPTYVRPPTVIVRGEGCYVWDVENRRYLDFTAGIAVNSLGHCDPGVARILAQQV